LLLFILLFDDRAPRLREYPRWTLSAAVYALPAAFVAGVLCWWWARVSVAAEFPHAAPLLTRAGMAMAGAPAAAALLYRFERTRPILVRLASPGFLKIAAGCLAGFPLANFTMVLRYRYFLGSANMYSGSYIDWQRTTWPIWANIRWYAGFYLKVFAPDMVAVGLLLVSAIWVAVSRNRRVAPYLLVFIAFFVSKPLNLIAAPHHTLLWLPWFALLCAFPVTELYSILARRVAGDSRWRVAAAGAAAVSLAIVAAQLTNGPRQAAIGARGSQRRLENISKATDWIEYRTPPGATLAMSYFCFNPGVFYSWMRTMDVPVPESAGRDGRVYIIWWGQRRELRGLAGYACATGGSVAAAADRKRLSVQDPGQVADVYSDPGFQRVASFGSGDSEVDLFRFDFRAAGR
jgi:hypothetical protein